MLNWVDWLPFDWILCVFRINYNANHWMFTNKININNESINCAPINRSSSNNNKIQTMTWSSLLSLSFIMFMIFNNLINLQYNTFNWLVFSIEGARFTWYRTHEERQSILGNESTSLSVLIDGKLPLFYHRIYKPMHTFNKYI